MSENHRQSTRQSYEDFFRSIIDDRSPEEVSPSGELLRFIERYYDSTPASDDTQASLAAGDNTSSGPSRNLQRRFSREPSSREPNAIPRATPSPPSLPPLRSHSRRASGMASAGSGVGGADGTGSMSSRSSRRARATDGPRFRSLMHSGGPRPSIDNAPRASAFRFVDLYDTSQPPLSPPLGSPPTNSQDAVEDSRRAKRRKIDAAGQLNPPFKGFRYGRFGQVEPGQLTMEIVSCDGGVYSEGSYAAENILKNDNSVYCAKSSRCNIVLRHQGATVFSLKELVIKAPGRSSFCSPVREGMVFVSMENDDLLTRTAQYQIQYVAAQCLGRNGGLERDHRGSLPPVMSIHYDNGAPFTRVSARTRRPFADFDEPQEDRVAQIPSEFTVAPPPFHVTTECSEEDEGAGGGGEDGRTRQRRRLLPHHIGALPFESDSGDDWSAHVDDVGINDSAVNYIRPAHPVGGISFNGNASGGRHQTLDEAVEASQLATQEAVRAVGGELLAPHARFLFEKDKNKCVIRFDPPVSGRFILLKMWNPLMTKSENIDIQSVIAQGFAGPRFFPSVEMR